MGHVSEESRTISVTVDPGMCMGVRSCMQIAPASFVLESGKIARGVVPPVDDLEVILEAAAACPNFAITVVVDGDIVFDPEHQ